jgi:hypothetical protein
VPEECNYENQKGWYNAGFKRTKSNERNGII